MISHCITGHCCFLTLTCNLITLKTSRPEFKSPLKKPLAHTFFLFLAVYTTEILTLPPQANAFWCQSCPSHSPPPLSLSLSVSSSLPAIQRPVCGKFLTHYTLCNVYTPAIMEAIDGLVGRVMNASN